MKVVIINGSPRKDGNTTRALAEMEKVFAEEGVEVETIRIGNQGIRFTDHYAQPSSTARAAKNIYIPA